jgi:hypothetical protein
LKARRSTTVLRRVLLTLYLRPPGPDGAGLVGCIGRLMVSTT